MKFAKGIISLNEQEVLIFFDESGKKEDHPILMGGLSIPKEVYLRSEFNDFQGTRTHWADFKPKQAITDLINLISKFESVVKLNIINYDYTAIERDSQKFPAPKDKEFLQRTIYAKFPERIFYGLLRRNVKYIHPISDIVIEEASEYKKYVQDVVENHLNVQAMYRGESFKVNSCLLKPKGKDVGLEITDLILGIVRFIIKNEPESKGSRHKRKIKFVINLLKDPNTYNLFSTKIMFFEWTKGNELKEVDFNNYLKAFISKNEKLWF